MDLNQKDIRDQLLNQKEASKNYETTTSPQWVTVKIKENGKWLTVMYPELE